MKLKKGYTLAEVLIALTIIGVIAATVVPLVNKSKPDNIKALYLKTYDSVVTVINKLAHSDEVYPVAGEKYTLYDANGNSLERELAFIDAPLANVLYTLDNILKGEMKLCSAMALLLSPNGVNTCGDETETYLKLQPYTDDNFKPYFTARNGVGFMVWSQQAVVYLSNNNKTNSFFADIYFDVNGEKGNNCLWSETCKSPDRFKLLVDPKGNVYAADPVGRAYLKTRTSLRKTDLTLEDDRVLVGSDLDTQYEVVFADGSGTSTGSLSGGKQQLQCDPQTDPSCLCPDGRKPTPIANGGYGCLSVGGFDESIDNVVEEIPTIQQNVGNNCVEYEMPVPVTSNSKYGFIETRQETVESVNFQTCRTIY